ncbi:MAG: nicotinate (nicotinamide) nucleotide adenylyltransferase [Wujia sp.]
MYEVDFRQFHTIAILGGSFNPIHNGHLCMASQVLKEYPEIEQLIIMPNHKPAYKEDSEFVSEKHRLKMASLAVQNYKNIAVSDFEIQRGGVTYTVETLEHLYHINPDINIYFVIGDDSLFSIHTWYRFEDILKLCHILVAARVEATKEIECKILELQSRYPFANIKMMSMKPFPVSSSEIRIRCQNNEDLTGLVPTTVQNYINENKLYHMGNEDSV